jgi:hypothetical protein
MTMVSTGPISLGGTATTSGLNQSVNVELGRSGTASINMNESAVRTLAAVPSGAISMSNFYGKSNRAAISFTYSSSAQSPTLNLSALGGYSAGISDITVTVNSGVYLWSDSSGSFGLNITGGTTGDTLTIVNNGFIMGRGGDGGGGTGISNPQAGGPALNLGFGMSSCTINHTSGTGYIGGGGGGGGGYNTGMGNSWGGGGAGGGGSDGAAKGGSIGNAGGNGSGSTGGGAGGGGNGGGGGRIFPGSGGSGCFGNCCNGGSSNNNGASAGPWGCGGGGGGWGASAGGNGQGGGQGGAGGGKAINTNGKSITYVSGNNARIWGAVS